VSLCLCGSDSLESLLKPLIAAHQGEVAIAIKHLDTGASFYHHADKPMPTASLIKFPVMIEVYQQVAEGKLKFTDPVTMRKEDKVPGSGVLTDHFSDGLTIPLQDAVRLMIVFSDNTATNLVLDKTGLDATAKRMETLGFPNTKIHSKVFKRETSVYPERSKEFGLGSTTAREMLGLLEKLNKGELVSREASKEMLGHLKKCDDKDKFTKLLPPGTVVAHKTGSVSDARTDAGIIYTKSGPIAVVVLTAKNKDTSWTPESAGNALCARVAKAVYDVYAEKR
jgi:beta-lactamase class A